MAFAFGLIQSPSCPVPAPWENLAGDQADSGIANSGGQIAHEKKLCNVISCGYLCSRSKNFALWLDCGQITATEVLQG